MLPHVPKYVRYSNKPSNRTYFFLAISDHTFLIIPFRDPLHPIWEPLLTEDTLDHACTRIDYDSCKSGITAALLFCDIWSIKLQINSLSLLAELMPFRIVCSWFCLENQATNAAKLEIFLFENHSWNQLLVNLGVFLFTSFFLIMLSWIFHKLKIFDFINHFFYPKNTETNLDF